MKRWWPSAFLRAQWMIFCAIALAGCATYEGITPLIRASKEGTAADVERLVASGANVNKVSAFGWSPLMFAAHEGKAKTVETLLNAGADPNLVSEQIPMRPFSDRFGSPPTTALQEAIDRGHSDVGRQLIAAGANVDAGAITAAGGTGDVALLNHLKSSRKGVPSATQRRDFSRALHRAAQAGNLETVRWLLKNGADPNYVVSERTALDAAVRGDHPDVVRYLLSHGARVNQIYGYERGTALHAATGKHTSRIHYARNLEVIRVLLSHGADRRIRDKDGETALDGKLIQQANGIEYHKKHPSEDPKVIERVRRADAHERKVIALLS